MKTKNVTIEAVTKHVQSYKRGVLQFDNGIGTEIFFNNAIVTDCSNGDREIRFEQVNNDTGVAFHEKEIDLIVENEDSSDPMYHIMLKDGTKINIFYLNPDFKKYDITNEDGDLLPDELAAKLKEAKDVVIGVYGNNLSIEKKSYSEVTLEANEEGDWDFEFDSAHVTLYEDSCNQIHCINDSEVVKQYVIKVAYMPFIEIHVWVLMK